MDKKIISLEKKIKCTKCLWEGRNTIEVAKPQKVFKSLGLYISKGVERIICPICGASIIPLTKKMVH